MNKELVEALEKMIEKEPLYQYMRGVFKERYNRELNAMRNNIAQAIAECVPEPSSAPLTKRIGDESREENMIGSAIDWGLSISNMWMKSFKAEFIQNLKEKS